MGWSQSNSRQQSLQLVVVVRELTQEDLYAAYLRCVMDKERMPFDQALAVRSIALTLKNAAKSAILRGGRK